MKKLSLISLFTLLMTFLSFQSIAQNISSVFISGQTWGSGNVIIETIKPDYTIETKDYSRKEERHLLVEIKRELDLWINKGFSIDQTNSNGSESKSIYRYTYILIKKEE